MTRKRNTESDLIVSASGAAAPARRKAATRTRAPRTTESVEATAIPAAEPVSGAVTETSEPSRDEIAALAYSYWEARGYQGGSSEEDWLRAEQELRYGRVAGAIA
jgi:hypothetical protein